MPHVFSFQVSPSLPPRLEALNKLSLELRWTWDHPTRVVFESLDPDLWEQTNHNPRLVLGRISQRRLAELASDEAFLAELDRAAARPAEYPVGYGMVPPRRNKSFSINGLRLSHQRWTSRWHSRIGATHLAYFSWLTRLTCELGLRE
jgi:hypothetical protein